MSIDTRLCACGSGLRAQRCCSLDLATIPPIGAAKQLLPLVQRALTALDANQPDDAAGLALEVLELAPGQPGALHVLYRVRLAQNQLNAAEKLLRRYVTLYPNEIGATCDLARLLMQRGNLVEAERHARNGVRIAPMNAIPHNLMGMILTEANRPRVGEFHYHRVLALTGKRDPIVLANLAWNLKTQGKIAEARALYEESVAAASGLWQSLLGWARMEEADRQFDRAADLLDKAEALVPGHQGVLLSRAVLFGRMKRYDEALAVLDAMATAAGASGEANALGPNEMLEKGRLLDRLGRYDEAFAAFDQGKRAARAISGHSYFDRAAESQIERLKTFFTAGRLGFTPRAGVRKDGPQPLFILGFPRSGTTLTEQILTAHPLIAAGDELPFVHDITNIMPRMLNSPLTYPEALSELWMGDQCEGLDNLRDYYLQRVRQLGVLTEGAAWFTDKMPLNETHLGLIALLFPEAPIIHVIRHPLDVVLSVFSNQLSHGFDCASELETAALHYLRITELVEHYRAAMTLRYLPIRYEDMIADQEGSVRRMLEFIGAPFDPACLDFTKNTRYARTASYAQVTERLYDTSRYRHRHYARQLEPARAILGPVIARLGYDVD